MHTQITGEENASEKKSHDIQVRVRYAPIKNPYVEKHAHASETLGTVKARALAHFHLSEGAVEGGSKSYSLSHDNVALTDLSVTIGQLATHHELGLLLVEQFTQG